MAVDQQTIERARLGDRNARDVLLRDLQDTWYRFAMSLLRDAEKARDATQETAVRFLRTLSGFRGQSSISTWSLGIALNVVREMRRARTQMSIHSTHFAETTTPQRTEDHSPLKSASSGELRGMLGLALNDLPERQREAIVLRFLEQRSVEETAEVMKCAEGTVKATVHQALRSLKQKFGVES